MNLDAARYIDRWVGIAGHLALHGLAQASGRGLPPLRATTPPALSGPAREAPRRLLGVKFYGLGNILMLCPTLQALRARFPALEIDFLTLPGNRALLEQSGLVDRVLTVDVDSFPRFVRSVMRLIRTLRARHYDTVLDFEQFLKVSGIFAFLSGARELIGFDTEGQRRGWLYTTRVVSTDSVHTQDIFLRLAAPLGVTDITAPRWRLAVDDGARARAREVLASAGFASGGPLVVMHIGTGESYHKIALKRWDVERFAAVADALVERHGARVAFTGLGADERALIEETIAGMRRRALDTCDRLDVGALSALVAEAAFVVTGDTSVMHLAGALGTPLVALLGPTHPLLYGPRGDGDLVFYKSLHCSPCLSNYNFKMSTCTNPVCMRSITVDEVLAGIEAQLLRGREVARPERRLAGS
jgi:ADP-heptose:LPS heptosyltransferase